VLIVVVYFVIETVRKILDTSSDSPINLSRGLKGCSPPPHWTCFLLASNQLEG